MRRILSLCRDQCWSWVIHADLVQRATVLERKASVILATESQLAGLDMSGFKRFIQYDITCLGCSLATRASAHASVIIFFMRHEVLAVNLMQDAGVPLSNQATDLLPLQHNNETGQVLTIEAVRTSCFKPANVGFVLRINTQHWTTPSL